MYCRAYASLGGCNRGRASGVEILTTQSAHTLHMQDGMFTHWDERLVAQVVTDTTKAVSPTVVSHESGAFASLVVL
jgi:hypothetical protein